VIPSLKTVIHVRAEANAVCKVFSTVRVFAVLTGSGFPVHKAAYDDGHTEHHFDHHYLQLATPLAVAVPSWLNFL